MTDDEPAGTFCGIPETGAVRLPASADVNVGEINGVLSMAAEQQVRIYPGPIPGIPAPSQRPSGSWGLDEQGIPTIHLAGSVAKRIQRTIAGDRQKKPIEITRDGLAWLCFAHEYAHSLGYDHGETGIGAECAGFRHFLVKLCLRSGVPFEYANEMRKAVRLTGPCTKWKVAP